MLSWNKQQIYELDVKSEYQSAGPLLVVKIRLARQEWVLKAARGPFPAGITRKEGGKEGEREKGISMEMRG